jgi:hypothetical protein
VSDELLTPEQVASILQLLSGTGARVLVIGGLAMTLHGSDHVTTDIDALYSRNPEDIEKLAAGMAAVHPRLRGAPPDLPFIWDARTLKMGMNFTFDTDIGRIDLLADVGGPPFEELWQRSVGMEVYGVAVNVIALDDLIGLKKAAGRIKDRAHLMELEALRTLLRASEDGSSLP